MPGVSIAGHESAPVGTDLSAAQDLLAEMRSVFAAGTPPPAARATAEPRKSATLLVHRYDTMREELPDAVIAVVDGWLAATDAPQTYESAHFRFAYSLTGPDAVPDDDVAPVNGIPDFVERSAAWGETAWSRLVDDTGFTAPLLDAGRVDVSFRDMAAYGFTRVVDGVPAMTLHHTFAGFPANDDPEGSAAGAAKVTIAHEFKHTTQYAASGWTEGGWLEADAVWAEDYVFDGTNDYLRYLANGSPISSPGNWMPVSYEDCVFPRLLSERHGPGILVAFFARRAAFPAEPVTTSYDAVLRTQGSSWNDAMATLGLWSWFCGANAPGRPTGFAEAARYPTPPIAEHLETARQSRLPGMGTDFLLATSPGRSGHPHAAFAADRGTPFSLWAVTLDRTGHRSVMRVPIASVNAGSAQLPEEWEDLATVTFVVTNAAVSGDAEYGVALDDEGAVDAPALAGAQGFTLHPNRPNPFRASTMLSYSLPARASVRISVFDAAGRLVRRLADGAATDAGLHELAWDGRDEAGRSVAPGFYAVRVDADGRASTRKMLVVR